MPDWSYRTVLRPLLLALGAERARRLAVVTLRPLGRSAPGRSAIDFLGHMRADQRLRRQVAEVDLAGPIALGALIDPEGEALGALSRFGAGLIEVGPVSVSGSTAPPSWQLDLEKGTVRDTGEERTAGLEAVARNLATHGSQGAVCVRIAAGDPAAVPTIVARLRDHAAMFTVEATPGDEAAGIRAAAGSRPVLLRITAADGAGTRALRALEAGAAGVWLELELEESIVQATALRGALPPDAAIIAGSVRQPDDARRLLAAGADIAVIHEGLVVSGPGLVKRCNEALAASLPPQSDPEPLSVDSAKRAWFWAFLLGSGMFAGGILAMIIASTRVVLPYDESLCGLTRDQMASLNPRLLPFMAHDRVSLAGTMLSIGIFYGALGWFGIRRGSHWAHVTVLVSAAVGFVSFFFFLGFGYFDPFHAFVTAILTQFTLLCLVLPSSPQQPSVAEWTETPAWRRGQWGQLLFILIGVGLTGAGLVISIIGCTSVFVKTDLEFMRTTAAELRLSYDRLVPLVAHDRASLGGMLIANGIAVWLAAQWGMRAGSLWLWTAFAWGGNLAFASALLVHLVVGYAAPLHLAPAIIGWIAWNVALALTRSWMASGNPVLSQAGEPAPLVAGGRAT